MQTTSLANIPHEDITNLPKISKKYAGLSPIDFDQAVKPLRKYLDTFNEDGKLAQMMLVDNVTNHVVDGMYVRELLIPQGAFILSRVHKRPLINVISKGHVMVVDTNGTNYYTAPATFISPAGTQRIVVAYEESVWNTVHHTEVTDPDALVEDLTLDNYEDFISYSNQLTHQE